MKKTFLLLMGFSFLSEAFAQSAESMQKMILEGLPDIRVAINFESATVPGNDPLIYKIGILLCKKDSALAFDFKDAQKELVDKACISVETSNLTALNFVPAYVDDSERIRGLNAVKMHGLFKAYMNHNFDLTHPIEVNAVKNAINFRVARTYAQRSRLNIKRREDVEFRLVFTAWAEEQKLPKLRYQATNYGQTATFLPTPGTPRVYFEKVIDPIGMSRVRAEKTVWEGGEENKYHFELSIDPPQLHAGSPLYVNRERVEVLPLSEYLLQLGVTQKLSGKKLGDDVTIADTLRIIKSFMDRPEQAVFKSIKSNPLVFELPSLEVQSFIAENQNFTPSRADLLDTFGNLLQYGIQETQDVINRKNVSLNPDEEALITIGQPEPRAFEPSTDKQNVIHAAGDYQEEYYHREIQAQNLQSLANGAQLGYSAANDLISLLGKNLR